MCVLMAEPLPLGPCTECECAAFERRKRDVLRSGDEKKQCGKCGHSKADHRIVSLAPRDVRAATGSAAASVQVPPARGINAAAPVPAPASPRADVTRAPRQDAQVTSVPASTTLRRAAPSSPSPSSSTTALSAGPATFSVPGASQVLPAPAKRDTQSPPVTETQSRIDAVKSFTQALFMGGIALVSEPPFACNSLLVNDMWACIDGDDHRVCRLCCSTSTITIRGPPFSPCCSLWWARSRPL